MRAINNILLLAAFIALCGCLNAKKSSSKDVLATTTDSDEFMKEHLADAAAHGAKEVFVYNPHKHHTQALKEITTPVLAENIDDQEKTDDEAAIRPNFENADLENFINFVAQLTKINVIPTKDTAGVKVSLNMRTNLTKKEVWEVFLTVTEMAGFTINKSGNVYKVLRQDAKRTEPLPAYINVPASTLPDSDKSIRFVTFLRNIQASEVEALLKGMLGSGGDLIRQDNVNGFIITDKCYNIKSAMTILNELDDAGLQEVVAVLPLKKTDATEVKKLLDDMTKSASDKSNNAIVARLLGKTQESTEYFSAATKIIVEERSNSLILLGNQKSIRKVEDFIAKYIERDEQEVESPIHRYQLEFTDATEIKQLLDNIVNSQTDSGAERYGGVRNGGKYFKRMRFEVDKESNSLLISSLDKNDWKLLKTTIKDLDKPQAQVAIETLIVDIQLDNTRELGGQIRSPRADLPFANIGWQSAAAGPLILSGTTPHSLMGNLGGMLNNLTQGISAFALSKSIGDVWAVFSVLNQNLNTSLVDNGFITIANRVPGTLTMGETRRVVSQTYSGASNTAPSYDNKEANTTFTYTPQINSDGLINLNIGISMASFTAGDGTTNKDFKSTLACADGQVLVLGGWVKTKATEAETSGMPILSEIPVLGWLFKKKNRSVSKTYTFFFICPTILKPRQKPGVDLYTKMKLHRARREVESSVLTATTKDPIHNVFFNNSREDYHHKVDDFANARFQPTTVDVRHDPFYKPGINDKESHDFKGEYGNDPIAQKLALASSTEDSKPAEEAPKEVKKDAPNKPDVQEKVAEKPVEKPQDSIIAKLSKPLKVKPAPQKTIIIPPLPPISNEKRAKFKDLFESIPVQAAPQIPLQTQRNALKELINGTNEPITQKRSIATDNTEENGPIIKQDSIDALLAAQEAKRAKFKESITLGDKDSKPAQAPLVARRKSLKDLLASYPSTTQNHVTNMPLQQSKG